MTSLRRRLRAMRRWFAFALLISPVSVFAQSIQPGKWDVTSTAVDLVVPGAPAFLLRMMKGKSKTERKCLDQSAANTGVAALLVPDPKAQCRVESLQVGAGRLCAVADLPAEIGAAHPDQARRHLRRLGLRRPSRHGRRDAQGTYEHGPRPEGDAFDWHVRGLILEAMRWPVSA